ncbi:glycosyltransferase [Neolewinella antarctica]|uniref:Glycosyltransferase involved in cell wall biosynthesis n=1 Tax=Neolewinella antarctica TaxID=442734 RepID=A0ABX0XB52_9BACT|nr:glycosyltransferase [Neolewinella antarctica]NJC26159.1 glycosyltransferase involved in cell wall biosynthesis [Neolewinella antarctica]
MAHLLKLPKKDQKGILLITHKEALVFNKAVKQIRFEKVNELTRKLFPLTELKPFYQTRFDELKKHYYVGQHFGWYHQNYAPLPEIDFFLCTKSTVSFQDESKVFRIPLSSSSFIHKTFRPMDLGLKLWDILSVSNNGATKRLREFVLAIRRLYDRGHRMKVLVVNKMSVNEPGKRFDNELMDLYYELFSDEERNDFVMMRLASDMSFIGMPSETIAQFMNLSKVFALFSEQEGEPRVVAEALICGLPVVTWKHIRAGGSIDHLNEQNSVRFETYEKSDDALLEAVQRCDEFVVDSDGLTKRLREDYTIEILKGYMTDLYAKNGETFDGEIEHGELLANAVNAHLVSVPWAKDRFGTADILDKEQFNIFYEFAMDAVPS